MDCTQPLAAEVVKADKFRLQFFIIHSLAIDGVIDKNLCDNLLEAVVHIL